MRRILFVWGILFGVFAKGQAPAIKWSHCYGDTLNNWLWNSITTKDSSIINVGASTIKLSNFTSYIVGQINKIDKYGNELWTKKQLVYDNFLYSSVTETLSGDLFAVGCSSSSNMGLIGGSIFCKLNSFGDTIFTKEFKNYSFNKIIETSKGDFILIGSFFSLTSGFDLSAVLISKSGLVKWEKHFGGSNQDEGYSAIELTDGSFTIFGTTHSNDGDVIGHFFGTVVNSSDAWLINIDSIGNKNWQKCIGGSVNEQMQGLLFNDDKTYWGLISTNSFDGDVIGNHGVQDSVVGNNPTDFMLVKLDSMGNIIKSKCFGGSKYDWPSSLKSDSDGNILMLGQTYKAIDGDHSGLIFDTVKSYAWLIKVDTNLNIIWNKHLGGVANVQNMHTNNLLKGITSSYIITGSVSSNGDDIADWHTGYSCNSFGCTSELDYWVMSLGNDGTTLPLKLLSFNTKLQQKNVLLNWQTANEVNVSHINIQRSSNNKDFTSIGKVNGSCCSYEFTDNQLPTTTDKLTLYYRLETVDKDSSKTYSSIQQITLNPKPSTLNIYPNPSNGVVTIECSGAKELLIIDYLGRTVKQFKVNSEELIVNTKQFPKGSYIVKATLKNGDVKTEKLEVE